MFIEQVLFHTYKSPLEYVWKPEYILWGKIADIQNGCVCLGIFKIDHG